MIKTRPKGRRQVQITTAIFFAGEHEAFIELPIMRSIDEFAP
jgi:hypothetical protein